MSEGNWKILKLFSGAGALFLTLLIALGFKIYYALDTHQPVLTDDYYEVGRDFDEHLRKNRNPRDRSLESPALETNEAGQTAALKRGVNLVPVEYSRKAAHAGAAADRAKAGGSTSPGPAGPIAGAQVSLILSRRATVNDDISARCVTDARGQCDLRVVIPSGGYWEGRFQATDPVGDVRFVQRRVYDILE